MEITHTQIVFFVFRIHFHCFILFIWFIWSKNMCKHTLTHIIAKKMQLLLEKIAKNHDFGNFWWFSCFWHDVTYDITVASYKVCLYFFWYQWTWEGHSYPLVSHTWCFVNRFPRSWGAESTPPASLTELWITGTCSLNLQLKQHR